MTTAAEAIALMERLARLQPTTEQLAAGLERIGRKLAGRETVEDMAPEFPSRERTAAAFLRSLAALLEAYRAEVETMNDDSIRVTVARVEVNLGPGPDAIDLRNLADQLEARG